MKTTEHKINLILEAHKILSVNALYAAKLVYGPRGPIATIYKSGEAKKTESYIGEQVRLLDIPVNYPWVNKNTLFKMDIMVIFSSGYLLRDLDNTLKLIQDGLFRALDINDSHVVEIHAHKKLMPSLSTEKILVCLSEISKDDIRYDKIPHPHIIWSEENILGLKSLPKRGIKEDVRYYTTDKELADTKLYILSPKTFTANTTMKIALDLYENLIEARGFGFIAIQGGRDEWGDENWAVIEEFKSTILEMRKSYSGIYIGDYDELLKEIQK